MSTYQRVAIVTDSSASLPNDIIAQYDITIVPQQIIFGDQIYRDGIDLDSTRLYTMLSQSKMTPTTSAPNPSDFLHAFYAVKERAESIICITLSQQLSATHNAAKTACALFQVDYPDYSIKLIDSETSIGSEGLIILAAARFAKANKNIYEVAAAATFVQNRVRQFAFLDTLHYVAKGGRVPKLAAWIGSLLQFKPLLELSQGKASLIARPRSHSKALERLIKIVSEDTKHTPFPLRVNLLHANAQTEIAHFYRRIEQELDCTEILVSEFAPVVGVHTGPGVLGLAYYSTEGEGEFTRQYS
jgi:DegV family protein with EDD domain